MNATTQSPTITIPALNFVNRWVNTFTPDPVRENYRRQVQQLYSKVDPTSVRQPKTLAYAPEVADLLGLSADFCQSETFANVFAGNQLLPGMTPHATCYGGHQFGHWAGQLGDGRAINLGEIRNASGQHWTLQLKGAGPTPYSRSADGLAVLRSSLREYMCSEAMHHLGVPTTRALSLITTGETVIRDMFYDGHPRPEPGAVVCRVAPSFTRFGHFELPAARQNYTLLKQLLDFTLQADFPELGEPSTETYLNWLSEVGRRTAKMIVHWHRVGFVHGVMNTDNMSILGLTIDYGPYGWLDDFDPNWTPNTTDANGRRYCFGNQPQIALWNLAQFANALYPLIQAVEPLQEAVNTYGEVFNTEYHSMMAQKLGLMAYQDSDQILIQNLTTLLQAIETDMTLFYRQLATIEQQRDYKSQELIDIFAPAYYQSQHNNLSYQTKLIKWINDYQQRLGQDQVSDSTRWQAMNQVNPLYVLRNYLAQQAIEQAEQNELGLLHELQDVLRQPYTEQAGKEKFAAKRPDWARHKPGCSMLSCSS